MVGLNEGLDMNKNIMGYFKSIQAFIRSLFFKQQEQTKQNKCTLQQEKYLKIGANICNIGFKSKRAYEDWQEDIFNHIGTQVSYNDKTIILENNVFNINSFLQSENQALVVDGEAGAGKSALIKKSMASIGQDTVILAFRCTDMDVSDERNFLMTYGTLIIDEVLKVY